MSSQEAGPVLPGRSVQHIIGPEGTVLTLADLPSPRTQRWVSRRKAEVVLAVNGGLLSLQDACRRYNLSQDEFFAWARAFRDGGMTGLRATRRVQ